MKQTEKFPSKFELKDEEEYYDEDKLKQLEVEIAIAIIKKKQDVKMKALDCLVEYPQGGFEKCNIRKERKMLETIYPSIDFTEIDQNLLWSEQQESIGELNGRINKLWDYIGSLEEKLIVVVSHSSYIGQLKDQKIGDENNELKHCYPYVMTAEYDDEKNFIKAYEVTNGIVEGMTEE